MIDPVYRQLAGQPNYLEFTKFLEVLIAEVTDVRTDIGPLDSLEIRKAMEKYLKNVIDTIVRIRKNEIGQHNAEQDF